jgi:single-strand DNA-binding protein
MNELIMTVSGWVATDPKLRVGANGVRWTTFRVASTARYFNRDKKEWVDRDTEWFTVRVNRDKAITVTNSIKKGEPVVATGRFSTNTWESDSGPRVDLMLDATSVGHDVTFGTSVFTRETGDSSMDVEDVEPGATDDAVPIEVDESELEEPPVGELEESLAGAK